MPLRNSQAESNALRRRPARRRVRREPFALPACDNAGPARVAAFREMPDAEVVA
jgi:hypothetical protein